MSKHYTLPDNTSSEARKRAPNAPPKGQPGQRPRARSSHADVIHRQLRQDIVAMRLVPGEPIAETSISEAFGVSRTPVREAILRLAEEQLVEVVPKSGTFVSRIPLSLLPDLFVARRALEAETVKHAVRYATNTQIEALENNLDLQHTYIRENMPVEFHGADDEFHALIAQAGGRRGVWSIIDQVKVHMDRCRHISIAQHGHMDRAVNEHTQIFRAIVARNEQSAVTLMGAHLDRLRTEVVQFRDRFPQYFFHDIDLETEMARVV